MGKSCLSAFPNLRRGVKEGSAIDHRPFRTVQVSGRAQTPSDCGRGLDIDSEGVIRRPDRRGALSLHSDLRQPEDEQARREGLGNLDQEWGFADDERPPGTVHLLL